MSKAGTTTARGRYVDVVVCVVLVGLAAGVPAGVEAALGLAAPMAGSDPNLWALSAMNLTVGAPSLVPPLWPGLIAAGTWAGLGGLAVEAAGLLGLVAFALIPPLTYLFARGLGAGPMPAGVAAAGVVAIPELTVMSVQVGADGPTALMLLLSAWAVWWAWEHPGWGRWLPVAALAGVAPLLREHGLGTAVLLALAGLLAPGSTERRLQRGLVVVTLSWMVPTALLVAPTTPWGAPWLSRMGRAASPISVEHGVVMIPGNASKALQDALEAGDRLGVALAQLERVVFQMGPLWVIVGLALACALVRGRRTFAAVLVGVGPILPALLMWSEARHMAVGLPVAVAAIAVVWTVGSPRARGVLGVACLALLVAAQLDWGRVGHRTWSEAKEMAAAESFGAELCPLTAPGDLAGGDSKWFLFCPMPQHEPQGDGHAGDWRVWWVRGQSPKEFGWFKMELGRPPTTVHRLRRDLVGRERGCWDAVAAPGTVFLAYPPGPALMAPACALDPASIAGDPAEEP